MGSRATVSEHRRAGSGHHRGEHRRHPTSAALGRTRTCRSAHAATNHASQDSRVRVKVPPPTQTLSTRVALNGILNMAGQSVAPGRGSSVDEGHENPPGYADVEVLAEVAPGSLSRRHRTRVGASLRSSRWKTNVGFRSPSASTTVPSASMRTTSSTVNSPGVHPREARNVLSVTIAR